MTSRGTLERGGELVSFIARPLVPDDGFVPSLDHIGFPDCRMAFQTRACAVFVARPKRSSKLTE